MVLLSTSLNSQDDLALTVQQPNIRPYVRLQRASPAIPRRGAACGAYPLSNKSPQTATGGWHPPGISTLGFDARLTKTAGQITIERCQRMGGRVTPLPGHYINIINTPALQRAVESACAAVAQEMATVQLCTCGLEPNQLAALRCPTCNFFEYNQY